MVECPICGLKRRLLFKHIRTHGYNCKDDFLRDYPDSILCDESISKKLSDIQKVLNKKDSVRESKRNALLRLWEDSSYREKMHTARSIGAKKQWGDRESESVKKRIANISKAQKELWKNKEYRENQCKSFKKRWEDVEYRNSMLDVFTNVKEYIGNDGNTYLLRSSYELSCVNYLNSLGIKFDYEPRSFEIYDDLYNCVRLYYPDFYIKSLDTYLEVKSTFYYNKDKYLNDLKLKTLRIKGYNIKLIKEKELESLDSFKQALYGCADT